LAVNTDKFKKLARRWVGSIGSGGVADAAVTTIPLASATNLPTDTAVVAVIDRVDANGTATSTTEESVIGVVSGSNLVTCTRGVEGTAQAHSAGAVVEILFTAKGINDLIDGLLVQHNQLGLHTNITACNITASGIVMTNTVAEKTSASGVTVDGLLIKDGGPSAWDGWQLANETWTYASATTITVPAGATSKYVKGDKIKLTQTTVKYFSVVGVASTVLTVTGGTDYTVANAAITSNYYSHAESPIGFPTWFNFSPTITWTAGTDPSGTPTLHQKFMIKGSSCTVNIFNYGYTAGATVTKASISLPANSLGLYTAYGQILIADTPNPSVANVSTTVGEIYCTSVSANRLVYLVTYPF